MDSALKNKLETIVDLVNNTMADPDIEIEYCIPEVETTAESCDVSGDPYLLVSYEANKYTKKKIRLTKKYLEQTPQEIANLITFAIEQFKEEIDAVQMG
ncbi:MAG: hypothetical protein ACLFQJ_06990 [Campylobacterales bacterium]